MNPFKNLRTRHSLWLAGALILSISLASCSGPGGRSAQSYASGSQGYRGTSREGAATAESLRNRPGLGTSAGYERYSQVHRAQFYRQSSVPTAVDSFHYNDEPGAQAMADLLGGVTRRRGLIGAAGDRLRVGLVSQSNRIYPHLEAKSRRIVMGQAGSNYVIRLQNRSAHRMEVIVSVDSINILNGQPANYAQRGYVIEPHGSIDIDGFRVSDERSKQFRFGTVAESNAAAKGQARNVGIIGLAVFEEDEAKARMILQREQFLRDDASAFPASVQ